MTKLIITLSAAAAAVAAFPVPAIAQSSNSEVIVYGTDPCPRSTESNVVVCVHRPETERYRLPKSQQLQGTRQQRQSWVNKSKSVMTAGSTGINSCSAVGPGGHTGCLIQEINQARDEARETANQQTPPQQ
jgi:hypothetical protein